METTTKTKKTFVPKPLINSKAILKMSSIKVKKEKEQNYTGKFKATRKKLQDYQDNYINSETSTFADKLSTDNNSIQAVIDLIHPDIKKLFTNAVIKRQKANSDGLVIGLSTGISIKIESVASKKISKGRFIKVMKVNDKGKTITKENGEPIWIDSYQQELS